MNLFNKKVEEESSQDKTVLSHLRYYGSITSMEAIHKYGITRLAAKIHNLRNFHKIETVRMPNKKGGTHALYEFKGEIGV